MKTSQKLVEKNNELRKELTPENEKFYSDVLVNLRLSNRNEQATEEIALDILQDLITAQNDGVSAEDFFGKDPKTLCADIVRELPKISTKEKFSYVWLAITTGAIILLYELLPTFYSGKWRFSALNAIMLAAAIMVVTILLLGYIKKTTFREGKMQDFIVPLLLLVTFFGGTILWEIFMPKMLKITLRGWPLYTIYLLVIVLAFVGLWQMSIKSYALWGLFIVMILTAIIMQFHLIPYLANHQHFTVYTAVVGVLVVIGMPLEELIKARKDR